MTTFEQRLKTFTNWPHGRNHAPEYMAAAGFLQNHRVQGHNDAAMCFNCDMTLASWDTAMDPVREHLDRNPRCTWIAGKMMNTQEKREETFGDWPFDELSYMMVAAAGFFQSDTRTHTVTCHSCQLTLGPQQLGNDPLHAHVRLDDPNCPCSYLRKATSSVERALPPTPPPTPPLPRHQCPVCRNRFDTQDGLRRHLADPKKAHLPRSIRAAALRRKKIAIRQRVPDLASRITRAPRNPFDQIPQFIKIEGD